jgi:hypothetical protein
VKSWSAEGRVTGREMTLAVTEAAVTRPEIRYPVVFPTAQQ